MVQNVVLHTATRVTCAQSLLACWTCPQYAAARINLTLMLKLFREAHSKVSQLWERLVGRYSELDCPIVRNSLSVCLSLRTFSLHDITRVYYVGNGWRSSPATYWTLKFITVFVRALQVSQFSPNRTRRLNIILLCALRATEWSPVHITFSM